MITASPFLAAAADAKLEDWGPLEEALPDPGGKPMQTSGTTLGPGRFTETIRKLYVLFCALVSESFGLPRRGAREPGR